MEAVAHSNCTIFVIRLHGVSETAQQPPGNIFNCYFLPLLVLWLGSFWIDLSCVEFLLPKEEATPIAPLSVWRRDRLCIALKDFNFSCVYMGVCACACSACRGQRKLLDFSEDLELQVVLPDMGAGS